MNSAPALTRARGKIRENSLGDTIMRFLVALGLFVLTGCAELRGPSVSVLGGVPQSLAEKSSGFTYIPLDPLNIRYNECETSNPNYNAILDKLPDNAVRIAFKRLDAGSQSSFGSIGLGAKAENIRSYWIT